jgi:hypothetical protein
MLINGSAWWRNRAARTRGWLVVSAGVGVAVATLAWGALPAAGETEPSSGLGAASCPASNPPNELTLAAGTPQTATTNVEGSNSGACGTAASGAASTGVSPAGLAGRPAKLAVGVGATQSTPTGRRFPIHFAVTVTDAEKSPVGGVLVTFAAPSRGPSGYFTFRSGGAFTVAAHTSQVRHVAVRTDACGVALAPAFTANRRAGGYVVVASVERMKAAFALVNEGS